jgi:uncharacterized protein YbjT (DUF2867 family)
VVANYLVMALKYLITGATGGLGSQVLKTLLSQVPGSDVAAASSRATAAADFENRGIQFRHVDYDDLETLRKAFKDVDNLFFVSSNTFDIPKRTKQHRNVIEAAREMGVGHVSLRMIARFPERI